MKISYLIARLIATFSSAFFLWFVAANIIGGGTPTISGIILIFIVLFAIISTIICWFKDELGALLLLISGIVFFIFSLVTSDIFIAIVTGGPFVLSSVILGAFKKEIRDIVVPPKREIISQE